MSLKFKLEQIAICPPDPDKAIQLLDEMGADEFIKDQVMASGSVFGNKSLNIANLAFNYTLAKDAYEFEVLKYVEGDNWMEEHGPSVSHFGMHCMAEELDQWRAFFAERGIDVAQEVMTRQHTNPAISGKRWYNYVIFNTRPILGVDIKFIVRKDTRPN